MAKNVLQKHWDGSKWVELHPVTKSTNVYSSDGKTIEQKLTEHINNTSNPHGVTKSQVGLGSVPNYGVATQAEAESGTASNKLMTPQRVKQAFEALQDAYVEETGMNSNGSYVRWSDGTQICFGVKNASITTNPAAIGLIHQGTQILTLPAEFVSIIGSSIVSTSQDNDVVSLGSQQFGQSSFAIRVWTAVAFENKNISLSFFAIGRWK